MSSLQKTALEHFDAVAANYEASTGGCTRELARYLISLYPPFDSHSRVLDNACGTGFVAQEILVNNPDVPLTIACTDGVAAMVDLAKHAVSATKSAATLSFDVMSGEELKFPRDHFTHSITNQGIIFFKDGAKGAEEIYRTLKPGGTAIVTAWKELGYRDVVQQAQKAVKPHDEPIRVPIAEEWFHATHLEETLRNAGFKDVVVHEKKVHYAAKSVDDARDHLDKVFAQLLLGWSEEERAEFTKQLGIAAEKAVVKVERPVQGSEDGETVEMVGFPMIALVAVARK